MNFDVDLFVIGGGSGGVRAARMAAQSGVRVGLAEESRMGGTCVIRGCVPKKLMVFASGFHDMPKEARAYGWDIEDGTFSWPKFREKLHAELDRLEAVYRRLLDGSKVKVYDQRASVVDDHTILLADGQKIKAKHILIATGGAPEKPNLPNADLGWVSDDIFKMDKLPDSMLIVGGGFIACEMASLLSGLGVRVTQFVRGQQILRGFDGEACEIIAQSMRRQGVNLCLETSLSSMEKAAGGISVCTTSNEIQTYEAVLFATGRRANSTNLGLESVGVKTGKAKEILVDAYSQTSVPSIYAIGDVTNRTNLTPVAIREGMAFVSTVYDGRPTTVNYDVIASTVFTQPELGAIGLTEEEARKQEPIEVYASVFRPMRSAFAQSEAQVLMKLIVSKATRKVLGCHIVAPGAGEMIQLAAVAITMGATKEDFDRTVAVHPTMTEEIVTMREAVRS